MKTRHILQTSCGLTVELVFFDASDQVVCVWSKPPRGDLLPSLLREYPRWRDETICEWLKRRGKSTKQLPIPKFLIANRH